MLVSGRVNLIQKIQQPGRLPFINGTFQRGNQIFRPSQGLINKKTSGISSSATRVALLKGTSDIYGCSQPMIYLFHSKIR